MVLMTTAFEPIGSVARWRLLYDLLLPLAPDDVVTWEEMAEALDLDPDKHRGQIRASLTRAEKEYSLVQDRSIVSVRGVGYRVVKPEEHVDLSRVQQRRAGRTLVRAKRHVDHVDLSTMSNEGKAIVFAVGRALNFQQEAMRRFDVRQRDLEKLTHTIQSQGAETAEKTDQNSTRIEELERRLAAFERTDKAS